MINTKDKNFRVGAVITGFMLLMILLGLIWTPYDPNAMNGAEKMAAPTLRHLLGTDNFGRDIFSRVLQGTGATFLIALGSVAIGLTAGLVVGGITAFPSLLLALVLIAVFDTGKYNIILALGVLFIPTFARIVRMEVARQKALDYVKNAKLMGVKSMRILFVHIMPNTLPVLLSTIAISFNNAVLAEASMSYLGLGVQPPDPSLGRMLNEAQAYLLRAPWYAVSTGLAIILLVLGFGLLSEGLGGDANA